MEILFAVCVIAAIVRLLAPQGVMKKYIEIICALCVICAMTQPIGQIIYEIQNINISVPDADFDTSSYDEIYNNSLVSGSASDAEQILEQEIRDAFLMGSGDIDVKLHIQVTDNSAQVVGVDVILIGGAVLVDPEQVRQYLLDRTGIECQIIYDIIVEKEKI